MALTKSRLPLMAFGINRKVVMGAFIFLIPYVLVSLIMIKWFTCKYVRLMWLSYFFTFSILLIYPLIFEQIWYSLKFDNQQVGCRFPLIFINFIFIPVSLIFQTLVHVIIIAIDRRNVKLTRKLSL